MHTLHTLQLPKQELKAEMIYPVPVSVMQFMHGVSCDGYPNPRSSYSHFINEETGARSGLAAFAQPRSYDTVSAVSNPKGSDCKPIRVTDQGSSTTCQLLLLTALPLLAHGPPLRSTFLSVFKYNLPFITPSSSLDPIAGGVLPQSHMGPPSLSFPQ